MGLYIKVFSDHPDGIQQRCEVTEWTTGKHKTAEMVFRAKYAVKHHIRDYHDTMDGKFFMYYIKNRLAPAFKARYPGKKMILVRIMETSNSKMESTQPPVK